MLLRRHGDDARLVVAQRLGELASAGDFEGVSMWKKIARCMDQLVRHYGKRVQ